MPSGDVSDPWRKYLRFSVRGLIVLVLVIGLWLGWIVQSARVQRDAVKAIRDDRGTVIYDWEWSTERNLPGGELWAPRWLVDLVGVDCFGHVSSVWVPLDGTHATMPQVARLTRVQSLSVSQAVVRDADLMHLKGLPRLSRLNLGGTQVSDAGLAHLNGLSNLEVLILDNTRITDAGLARLKGLTKLSYLGLYRTQVTDVGLAYLKGLTKLSILNLRGTKVSDAGLRNLDGLMNLRELGLGETQVTDAGSDELKRALPSLTIKR